MNAIEPDEWHFDFGLCVTNPSQSIPASKCEELLNLIVDWAEKNELGIGGGYRRYTGEEE